MIMRTIIVSLVVMLSASLAFAQSENGKPLCSDAPTNATINNLYQFIADQQGQVNGKIFPKIKLYQKQLQQFPSSINPDEKEKALERQLMSQLNQNKDFQSLQNQLLVVIGKLKALKVDPRGKMTPEQKNEIRPLLDQLAALMLRRAGVIVTTSQLISAQDALSAVAQAGDGVQKAAIQWTYQTIQLYVIMSQQKKANDLVGLLMGTCD